MDQSHSISLRILAVATYREFLQDHLPAILRRQSYSSSAQIRTLLLLGYLDEKLRFDLAVIRGRCGELIRACEALSDHLVFALSSLPPAIQLEYRELLTICADAWCPGATVNRCGACMFSRKARSRFGR